MRLIIDTREQMPYAFTRYPDVEWTQGTLATGDVSILGWEDRVAIERKNSVDELVMCLSKDRERFEKELIRARSYDFFAVVIEDRWENLIAGRYRSQMLSKAAVASVSAFSVRYRIPFLWAGHREGGEFMTYSLLSKFCEEVEKRHRIQVKAQKCA
jgi:DNA excision repair protein ERCC-4